MSNPKKGVNLRISEELLKELEDIVRMCHDFDFPVNRSDLISTFLYTCVSSYTVGDVTNGNPIEFLEEACKEYYERYDLCKRREDGVED